MRERIGSGRETAGGWAEGGQVCGEGGDKDGRTRRGTRAMGASAAGKRSGVWGGVVLWEEDSVVVCS